MAKRRLGQHFLFDPAILRRVVDAAQITSQDTVVEIGPGHGRLTKMLSAVAERVIAIELDRSLCEKLREELAILRDRIVPPFLKETAGFQVSKVLEGPPAHNGEIELICGDALKYPYEELGLFKVVANIPYYITTPIIFMLMRAKKNLQSMTLTVQKEVARRISAKPNTKDYGVLSIGIQFYAEAELKFIIPRGAFQPVPAVDSAVIHISMHKQPFLKVTDEDLYFKVVRTAFLQRRKTIANALKGLFPNIKTALEEADIETLRRPETLSLEDFGRLAHALGKHPLPVS